MKKLALVVFAGILTVGIAAVALAAETTVTGDVEGSFCYLTMGAHGPKHHNCAVSCVKKGIPAILIEKNTGKMYVLEPTKRASSLPKAVLDKLGHEATITGTEYSKGGLAFLTVNSIK